MTQVEELATSDMPQVEALATTVSNLVVTPQTNGVSVSYTTNVGVAGQLQIGTTSGTYPNKFTIESVPRTVHQASGYGLSPATTYHYILQFYDGFGNLLDATADATFTTASMPAAQPTGQSSLNGPPAGGGASVGLTAGAAIAASVTTVMPQNAASYAAHGAAGAAIAAGKLTVQSPGFYALMGNVTITADISTGAATYLALLVNGAVVAADGVFKLGTTSAGNVSYIGNLAAGAVVELEVVNGTATATTVASGSIGLGGLG